MKSWRSETHLPLPGAGGVLPERLDRIAVGTLGLLGVLLPYSVAGVSLVMGVLLVLTLSAAGRLWTLRPWREPAMAAGLLLLAFIALHTVATTGWTALSARTINRYHELLLAVVLLAWFRAVSRPEVFLRGLAVGAVLYAGYFWLGPYLDIPRRELELRRISASFILSVCCLLMVEQAPRQRHRWLWWLGAALLATTVLFRIEARTGHLVLVLLAGVVAWIRTPARWRLAATVLLPLAVIGTAWMSPLVVERATETWNVVRDGKPEAETSTGVRMALLSGAAALAREHYAAGIGYARYSQVHAETVQRLHGADPAWAVALQAPWVRSSNPHNEYLMQLVGGGAVALLLFLAWLAAPLFRRDREGRASPVLVGTVLAFAVGCLFNSMLMDYVEGHFYASLLAWLLARQAAPPVPAPA